MEDKPCSCSPEQPGTYVRWRECECARVLVALAASFGFFFPEKDVSQNGSSAMEILPSHFSRFSLRCVG